MNELKNELMRLKDKINYVSDNKEKIKEKYGSLSKYYYSNFKKNISEEFPNITKFIEQRKKAGKNGETYESIF